MRQHEWTPFCWCMPKAMLCECETHEFLLHRNVMLAPDVEPRATSYGNPLTPPV